MNILKWVFVGLSTILLNCKGNDENKVTFISPTLVIDGFNDSTHISQAVFDIETAFNSYFVPDANASRIYRIDSLLNLTEIIGRPGRGPGELVGPVTLCFSAHDMYVADGAFLKVFKHQINHWEYKDMSKIPPITAVNENNPFLVHGGNVYFASPLDHWVTKYRISDSSKVAAFGELFDLQPKIDRNIMQLLDFNNSLYVIGVGEAVIYRYSYEGELISFKDFREEAFFSETTSIQNSYYREDSSNGLNTIFQASAVINNKIHIIFYHRQKDKKQFNKVLVIDPELYDLTKIYELDNGGYYTCISPSLTSKNGFITFNAKRARIELFDLD